MRIVIAPSKTQSIRSLTDFVDYSIDLSYKDENLLKKQFPITKRLVKAIINHPEDIIGKKMKLSDKLLNEVVNNYKNFNKSAEGHSILSYTGTVFKELKIESYDRDSFEYMNKHIIILSALYGPMPAFAKIKPYRLDMNMSFFEKSVYHQWSAISEEWFKDEDFIIDLASKEFSKLIIGNKISIEFLQCVDGEFKTISYHSKQGRGFMLHYLIENQVTNIEDIKKFNASDYSFDEGKSTKSNLVFSRKLSLIKKRL
jgi:hypothetical protein